MGGQGGIRGGRRKGVLRLACMGGRDKGEGWLYNTERTSGDSTTFCYADGQ